MLKRDYRNIIAGAGLSVFGLAAAAFALSKYSMGTISRMGPGMMLGNFCSSAVKKRPVD